MSYSPPGSPVSISRRLDSGPHGRFVEIAVTDRGLGIDQARARSTGGTGLGLAIVKHVAANHGGEVTVWSEPGRGSTFTIRLPAAVDHAVPTRAAPAGAGHTAYDDTTAGEEP